MPTSAKKGAFTFVLHTHLPYCRLAGRWPHGEEWLHEALSETYIPLLNALYDLRDEGVDYKLTIGLTPVLTEQLADASVLAHLVLYLEEKRDAATADVPRFQTAEEPHLAYLASFYRDFYQGILDSFHDRYGGDVVGAFRRLQDEGYLEIVTCAATHGYLPLLGTDASIYGQLRTGVASYKRHFGRMPRAIWLPECAYRPAYRTDDGEIRPALEEFLAEQGVRSFFAETHAVEGGRPVGKAADEVAIGPYAAVKRRYIVPIQEGEAPKGTTYKPYYVVGSGRGLTDPPVSVIARNNRTGMQVWSGEWGYPGDQDYREFHKKDHISGMQYWRVTGPNADLGDKEPYHPDWAAHKVASHADHYAHLVEELLASYAQDHNDFGLIASNYDTELFGHWWFEGIDWIKGVLRRLADSPVVALTTASEFLAEHPPEEAMTIPESSWGSGGNHWTWDNPDTHWMWNPIHEAEARMRKLAADYDNPNPAQTAILNQAARELLLLQSSDWPFLVTTGQAKQYAIQRFQAHIDRFETLADLLETDELERGQALAEAWWEIDKVFPNIDYRWFKPYE
jgi:1,4-alpha-glucan branching enzyme